MHATERPLTALRMTLRNLARRPMRTSLTALGVSVGVVAIVALTTIVSGLWDAVEGTIHAKDTDLLVFQRGIAADILSNLDEQRTERALRAIPGVRNAVPTLWHVLPVEGQPFCLMIGLRLVNMRRGFREDVAAGRLPESDDEIVLGAIARRMLGKKPGDTLEINGQPYRVAGVVESPVVFINGAVFMSLPRLQALAGKQGRVTTFQVYLEEHADRSAVADRIEQQMPNVVAVGGADEYHKADRGLEIANATIGVVSFIAIVIGAIIVANTMWMSVLERTREIGILRAVGWSRPRIVGMILLEAVGLGVIAAAVGSALGAALAEVATWIPVGAQFVDPAYGPKPFVLALAVAVGLSALGALAPAWRAARISPAEALRYE